MAGNVRDILINLLGRETVSTAAKKAAGGVDDLGGSMKATAGDAKRLDREIEQAEAALRDLALQYARTDDAAQRMDLAKAMRKQQAEIRRTIKAKDLLPDVPDAEVGGWVSRLVGQVGGRLGPALARVPVGPIGAALGAAVGAAVIPTLGAAIAGGVIGGVGIGGVIGGVKLASQDARVQAAAKDLAAIVSADLEDSGAAFVTPTIRGIGEIRSAWADVSDEVDESLAATSGYVEPLARGLANAVREIAPGLRDAAVAAKPIVDVVGDDLPRLFGTVGDVLTDLSDNADEGASAIHGLFMATEATVRSIGWFVGSLADAYRGLVMVSDGVLTVQENLLGWNPLFKGVLEDNRTRIDELKGALDGTAVIGRIAGDEASGGLQKVADGAAKAGVEVRSLKDLLDDFAGKTLDVREANRRVEEAIDAVAEAVKRNGATLDIGTEAGRENQAALDALAESYRRKAEATFATTQSQEQANAVMEAGRERFIKAAEAMGMEAGAARELADDLFAIPNIDRSITIENQRALTSISQVQQSLGRLKDIHRGIYYTVKGDLKLPGGTQLKGLSGGGPVTGPGPKGVDSEPRLLAPGEYVLPADEVDAAGGAAGVERLRAQLRGERSAAPAPVATAAAAAGGSGGGVVAVVLSPGPGWSDGRIIDVIFEGMQTKIRNMGGNVQDALGS